VKADANKYLSSNGVDKTWRTVVGTRIPTMLCPSDANNNVDFSINNPNNVGPWARGNYAASAGGGWFNMAVKGESSESNGGKAGKPCGGVFGINWGASLKQITDGTASTIMINEVRAGLNSKDRRGVWAMGVSGSSVTSAIGLGDCLQPNDNLDYSDDIENCNDARQAQGTNFNWGTNRMGCSNDNQPNNWPNWQANARSMHAGGVNACFADGSVRFIFNSVPSNLWIAVNSRDDAVVLPNYYGFFGK